MAKSLLSIGAALVALWIVLTITRVVVTGALWFLLIVGVVMVAVGVWNHLTGRRQQGGST